MEERSLKVVDSNKTFFGKLSKTLSKIIIPTKIGINGIVINLKRNNLLKAYEAMNNSRVVDEEKKKVLTSKYQEAYSLYLEAIDKYIMDTVYKKVKTNTASEFEKEAMGNYYKVTVLKENEYVEYKYQKQKYLIELDYESLKLNSKAKLLERYKTFYIKQMDSFYKGILKNYSVKLAETSRKNNSYDEVYNKIFNLLSEYVEKILYLKLQDERNEKLEEKVGSEMHRLDQFDIGTLDAKDYVEKNMLLLAISRQVFTHSLPLVATEQCYNKLLKDIRRIITMTQDKRTKAEAYAILLDLLQTYDVELLSGKVYWEKMSEKEKYKKFYEEYEKATTNREKEILLLKRELQTIENDDENKKIVSFYKNKLTEYGVMKNLRNECKTYSKYTRNR